MTKLPWFDSKEGSETEYLVDFPLMLSYYTCKHFLYVQNYIYNLTNSEKEKSAKVRISRNHTISAIIILLLNVAVTC